MDQEVPVEGSEEEVQIEILAEEQVALVIKPGQMSHQSKET
jgi:hypothetical protein